MPILGICYGTQLTALTFGGKVIPAERREYGRATVRVQSARRSVPRLRRRRGDPGLDVARRPRRGAAGRLRDRRRERELPGGGGGGAGAQVLGRAVPPRGGAHAARRGDPRRTSCFASAAASRAGRWPASSSEAVAAIRRKVGTHGRAVCGLSGGVDSSVAAALVLKAMGPRLTCIFVDTGLQRANEAAQVRVAVPRRVQGRPARRRRERAVPRQAGRRQGPGAEAQDHRPRVHRRVRGRGEEGRRRGVPRAGDAVPGRDRVGVVQGAVGDDQVAPQRGRAARADAPQADRAAARAVQGRGARAGRRDRPAAPRAVAAAVPRPGAGGARAGRGDARALRRAARRRRDHRGGDPRRRPLRGDLAVVRRAACPCSRSA